MTRDHRRPAPAAPAVIRCSPPRSRSPRRSAPSPAPPPSRRAARQRRRPHDRGDETRRAAGERDAARERARHAQGRHRHAQRSTSTQFGKLTERLDRADKAQAEPSRQARQDPGEPSTGWNAPAAAAARPPPRARGHRLGDAEGAKSKPPGRRRLAAARCLRRPRHRREPQRHAVRVVPGSNLPGLGKVETIKRENGKRHRGDAGRHHRRDARAAAGRATTTAGERADAAYSDLLTGGAARQPPVAFRPVAPVQIRVRFPFAVPGGWRTDMVLDRMLARRARGADRAARRRGRAAVAAAAASRK